jgi:Tfp pilus assembly protein PilE
MREHHSKWSSGGDGHAPRARTSRTVGLRRTASSAPLTSPRCMRGLTLIEMASVLVISGLMLQAVMSGQNLIQSARLQSLSAQEDAVAAAILMFQERYRALPGDYANSLAAIACEGASCPGGDENGLIDADSALGQNEHILAWTQLSAAGFLNGFFRIETPVTATPSPQNSPQNAFGGYIQFAHDRHWGPSGNTTRRLNAKTGNQVPVALLAALDRRVDDGLAGSGNLQFSTYSADANAPPVTGEAACVTADAATADWNVSSDQSNCGATWLLKF